jgi:hypothetical protein
MAADLTSYSTYAGLDASQKREIWSEAVRIDARNKNVMKDFIGPEGSGKPICEKRDLAAGGNEKVTFTTTAPFRAAGVIGNGILKDHTGTFVFGDFSVTVDMRAFGIGHEQLLQYMRFNKGMTPKQLGFKLCKELWGRMEQDDCQIVLRNKALFNSPNMMYIGGGTSLDELTLGDTFDTSIIETSALQLEGQGCLPLQVDQDEAGADVPQYVMFGPKKFLYPLENEQKFREALLHAEQRGKGNPHWTGKFAKWKNSIVHRHAVIVDTANGRQGSPLEPMAFLGKALTSASADITGGGAYNSAGSLTDALLFDYFAYFGGYWWKTHTSDVSPTDNNTYYAIIYNVSGSDRGKYEIISYVAAANDGNHLAAASVTRELDTDNQKTQLTAAGRYTNAHPSGSLIIPCNKLGVPIGYALHMGAEALFMAKGAVDAERLTHKDDYENDAGEGRIRATGIQGIRGYSPYEDTLGRFPNFLLVAGAVDRPELDLIELTGT